MIDFLDTRAPGTTDRMQVEINQIRANRQLSPQPLSLLSRGTVLDTYAYLASATGRRKAVERRVQVRAHTHVRVTR